MNDPRIDNIYITQFAFAVAHLVYFIIYYSRYSALNQKLTGISKMEKAEVIDQEVIDASRVSINTKIKKLRKWSLLPVSIIAVVHLFVLQAMFPRYITEYGIYDDYYHYGYITIAGFLLVLAGNYVKGAQIFDPNKRFWGGLGRRW